MASATHKVIVIEHSRVSPPPGTVIESSLPLTFFDIPNLFYFLTSLFFYRYSKCDSNILIPILKHSLSITLKHFFPFAGNLILYNPNSTKRHEIRYVDGDCVQVTFVSCDSDFDDLVEKNPISLSELLPFSSPLSYSVVSDSIVASIMAIQVTFFGNGICIGIKRDHGVADANTWVRFARAWALVTKTKSDESLLACNLIPSFDRSVITDSKDLYNVFVNHYDNLQEKFIAKYQILPPKHDIFLGTFVITLAEIHELKKLVAENATSLPHISSFVVVSAYIWSCLAKLHAVCEEGTQVMHFGCAVSVRERISTIPHNYFGNCILPCGADLEYVTLASENGVIIAAEKIGGAISNLLNNEKGILDGAEKWLVDLPKHKDRKTLFIGGSPKFSLHDIDFGWGMPEKTGNQYMSERAASLNGTNDPHGGLEIGLSLSKDKMDAFISIFKNGLNR